MIYISLQTTKLNVGQPLKQITYFYNNVDENILCTNKLGNYITITNI